MASTYCRLESSTATRTQVSRRRPPAHIPNRTTLTLSSLRALELQIKFRERDRLFFFYLRHAQPGARYRSKDLDMVGSSAAAVYLDPFTIRENERVCGAVRRELLTGKEQIVNLNFCQSTFRSRAVSGKKRRSPTNPLWTSAKIINEFCFFFKRGPKTIMQLWEVRFRLFFHVVIPPST